MKHLLLRTLAPLLLASMAQAQLTSDVQVQFTILAGSQTKENFVAYLDWKERPVTTTNFMLLAGLEDEIWAAPADLQALQRGLNFASQGNRPPLRVSPIPGTNDYQVTRTLADNFTRFTPVRLVGDPAVELREDSPNPRFTVKKGFAGPQNQEVYLLTLEYKHTWFDNRAGIVRDTPYYKSFPNFTFVDRGEAGKRGRRIFAGSSTNFAGDGPGYTIPDELFESTATLANPWGLLFSSQFSYVLAMDNLTPNSAGGRFFITGSTPQPEDRWQGNFTPFGAVPDNGNQPLVNRLFDAPVSPPINENSSYLIEDIQFIIQGNAAGQFFPHEWHKEILPTPPIPDKRSNTTITSKDDKIEIKTLLGPLEQVAYLPSSNLLNPIGGLIYGLGNADNMPKAVNTEIDFLRVTETDPLTNMMRSIISPQGFFQPYVLRHKQWPSLTYNQSNGLASKQMLFTEKPFLKRDPMAPIPNPIRVFRMNFNAQGTGGILNVNNINYEFGASYNGTTSPYLGVVKLRDMPEILPLEEIRLLFDARILNPNQIRLFVAVEPEAELARPEDFPPNIPFQPIIINPTFSGVWQDLNPN